MSNIDDKLNEVLGIAEDVTYENEVKTEPKKEKVKKSKYYSKKDVKIAQQSLDLIKRKKWQSAIKISSRAKDKSIYDFTMWRYLLERNNNANRILEVTEQISDRMTTFINHVESIGKGLNTSIRSYNKTIGSYNRKLLPAQRKLNKLKGSSENLAEIEEIDENPREIQQKLEMR